MRTTMLAAAALIGLAVAQSTVRTDPAYSMAAAGQSGPVRTLLASTENSEHSWATFDRNDHTRAAEGDDYES